MRSTGLLREPGDAVASGDVASDAAGDVAEGAQRRGARSCNSTTLARAALGGRGASPFGLVLDLKINVPKSLGYG